MDQSNPTPAATWSKPIVRKLGAVAASEGGIKTSATELVAGSPVNYQAPAS